MWKLILLACLAVNALVDSIPLDEPVVEGYVFGGKDVDISQVPYHVAVFMDASYECGGAIITPNHIVTAAQCVHYPAGPVYSIRAGSVKKEEGGVTVKVKSFTLHPKYNRITKDYNIAILELTAPLKLDDKTMKAIKLGAKEPATGTPTLAIGWGGLDDDSKPFEKLQSVTIPIYDRKKCQADLNPDHKVVSPRMICAGEEKKGSSILDEGGPLVYNGELVGIFNYGPGKVKRTTDVYTNIPHPEITKFIKDTAKL